MMDLFRYPKVRHIRKLLPPSWKSYHLYKPILQQEFRSSCVYCRLPDASKGIDSFGVDHYRPKSKFPHLVAEYLNLFYACNCCNRNKADFWPDSIQMNDGHFIPNPCEHIMFDHLRYDGVIVSANSVTGTFAIDLLDLNDDASIEYRQMLLDIVNSLKEKYERIRYTISRIDRQIRVTKSRKEKNNLKRLKTNHEKNLFRLESYLEKFSGK